MTTCTVAGCAEPTKARGWCKKHYVRWRQTGDPLGKRKSGPRPRPVEDRFWEKVEKTSSCWLWKGAKASKYGHGKFGTCKAHRVAYELAIGPIPDGLTIDHLCRNPPCVNPEHLEPVTLAENLRRQGAAKLVCPQGHPLSGANLYRQPRTGHRCCRQCRNAASRTYRARTRRGS